MQVEHLPYKDLHCFGVPKGMHLGESLKVDVVGRVERLPLSALASEFAGKGAGSDGEQDRLLPPMASKGRGKEETRERENNRAVKGGGKFGFYEQNLKERESHGSRKRDAYLGYPKDEVRDRRSPPEARVIFNVVDHQRRIVELLRNVRHGLDDFLVNLEPLVERRDHSRADSFTGELPYVREWLHENLQVAWGLSAVSGQRPRIVAVSS
jgi:hypothetical protein